MVRVRTVLVMTCICGVLLGCGDRRPDAIRLTAPVPAGWVAIAPPELETSAANCANWADDHWSVSLSPDSAVVQFSPRSAGSGPDTIRVSDGLLTGDDLGEFGGAIWWQGRDGTRDTLRVVGRDSTGFYADNLHSLFHHRGELYALVGLGHLGLRAGELLHLRRAADGRWRAQHVLDLGGAPLATTWVASDSLLILTGDSLLVLQFSSHEWRRRALHGSNTWWLTYPLSLVRDRFGVLYIGMRSAVARLRPTESGYREDWLVPAACRRRIPVGDGVACQCVSGDR
jgi:hypothetical protein